MERIRRRTYFIRTIILAVINSCIYLLIKPNVENINYLIIFSLIIILIGIYQTALRLHDINKSGWLSILTLIPILNLAFICLYFIDGTIGDNKYGEDPKGRKKTDTKVKHVKPIQIYSEKKVNFKDKIIEEKKDPIFEIEKKIELLSQSLDINIITKEEYDGKVKILENKKEQIKSEKTRKKEQILKEKENQNRINNKVIKLKSLLDSNLINTEEFHKKVKDLHNIESKNFTNETRITFTENLKITKLNGLYGYVNENNEIVIKHQFEDAYPFSEGLAAVITNSKRGYINEKGQFIIPPIYDKEGTFFKNGKADVSINGVRITIKNKVN